MRRARAAYGAGPLFHSLRSLGHEYSADVLAWATVVEPGDLHQPGNEMADNEMGRRRLAELGLTGADMAPNARKKVSLCHLLGDTRAIVELSERHSFAESGA